MEILVIGSSLARQVVKTHDKYNEPIDSILFKGKMDLDFIDRTMKNKNKQYTKIVYLSGNDIIPTRLHKLNKFYSHVCLDKFDEVACVNKYTSLVKILSFYTRNIIFCEPPPRATSVDIASKCAFFDQRTANRFRNVINSLKSGSNIGVLSNCTVLGFLNLTNSPLCASDQIHFSRQAIGIIHKRLILEH